jgi:hypothetical protein
LNNLGRGRCRKEAWERFYWLRISASGAESRILFGGLAVIHGDRRRGFTAIAAEIAGNGSRREMRGPSGDEQTTPSGSGTSKSWMTAHRLAASMISIHSFTLRIRVPRMPRHGIELDEC